MARGGAPAGVVEELWLWGTLSGGGGTGGTRACVGSDEGWRTAPPHQRRPSRTGVVTGVGMEFGPSPDLGLPILDLVNLASLSPLMKVYHPDSSGGSEPRSQGQRDLGIHLLLFI